MTSTGLSPYARACLANQNNPQTIARNTLPFWLDVEKSLQECRDIRAEERRDGIRRENSLVKLYQGEEGSFTCHAWQVERVRAIATDEEIQAVIGPFAVDELTARVADWLFDWISTGRHRE